MSINAKCLKCGAESAADDELAGKVVGCPKCKAGMVIPDGPIIPDPEPAPAAAPSRETIHLQHVKSAATISRLLIGIGDWSLALSVFAVVSFIVLKFGGELHGPVFLPCVIILGSGVITFGLFRAAGHGLRLLADIEENTR